MLNNSTACRISVVDEDPLRARKDARELLAEIADADPGAALDIPNHRTPGGTDKGGLSVEAIGVVISAASLAVAGVQLWLSRVPQRTIVAERPDGATLRITGKEAREDDTRIERFLAGGTTAGDDEDSDDAGDGADGGSAAG
ncbi:hypothetical protein [Streptomyces hoynatensis]|uniref:hypothetical protein n=1 Tax=Streptomyces hoynatensis TaxID=1141874 RepID=UPI001F4DBAD2|nr:hypothetical protein [Streptomyces hoynatensis]